MALGVTVISRSTPPSRGMPVATDAWHVAAVTDVGTLNTPVEVRDMLAFEDAFGPRNAGNIELWDNIDVYFREGGKRAVISRGAASSGLQAALDAITERFGPGQVSALGYVLEPTATVAKALWAHAKQYNRIALVGLPPATTTAAAMGTYTTAIGDTLEGYGGVFGFDVVVPGAAGVVGGPARTVSAVPVVAALCARVDETGNPNQAAAGRSLPLQYVSSLTNDPSMTTRETFLEKGVNTLAEVYGVLENYGFQTPVVQHVDNAFWQLNCSRTRMALVAQSLAAGEQFMFKTIDGQGKLAGDLKSVLDGVCLDLYQAGALFGATPSEAFYVDTGSSVNTPETIAAGKLRAAASVVLSLHAKAVEIELVTIPIGSGTASPAAGPGSFIVQPTTEEPEEEE